MPAYLACIELLGDSYRRWGGVAMDVFFDHLLARQWQDFSELDLTSFSQSFYDYCLEQQLRLPMSARRFIVRAADNDLFRGYADREIFIPVLQRIDQRVRFDTNLVEAGYAVLDNYSELERRFKPVMQSLIQDCQRWR